MKKNQLKKLVTTIFAAILTFTSVANIPVRSTYPGTDIVCNATDPNPLPEYPDREIVLP